MTYVCITIIVLMLLLGLRSSLESVSVLPPKKDLPSPFIPGGCNKFSNGSRDQFYPPDNPYRSNTHCTWIIEMPKGYRKIRLIFHDIEIE